MKIFMVHVGNEVKGTGEMPDRFFLRRKRFLDGEFALFLKHDIVNADTQMNSLTNAGVIIEYGHFSNRRSIVGLLKAGVKIWSIARRKDISLIHVMWGSTTGLLTCIFSSKPVVISFCGSDLLGNKNADGSISISGRINRFLSQTASLISAWNITKSSQMARQLPVAAQKRTTVIPNGVDLAGFFPMDRDKACERLNWEKENKYVLFFYTEGQVVKNPDMAMEIFRRVKNRVQHSELKIVRKVPHEDLVYYYNAADVLIITSFHEGSNNSLKEAKACNLPIVTVDVGDAEERLTFVKNCYVIRNWDIESFVDKVTEVLLSEERSNGNDLSNDVSLNHVSSQIVEVYNKILSQK